MAGIKALDTEEIAPSFSWHFYSKYEPFWGNVEMIRLDLSVLQIQMPDEELYKYIYQASLDIWRALTRGGNYPAPDPTKTIAELSEEGIDQDMLGYLECYVRYRTEYLILVTQFPYLVGAGAGEKVLGDFRISRRGNIADLKQALDTMIEPEMNACYHALVGNQRTKAPPRTAVRASTQTAVNQHKEARQFMPAGIRQQRNWEL